MGMRREVRRASRRRDASHFTLSVERASRRRDASCVFNDASGPAQRCVQARRRKGMKAASGLHKPGSRRGHNWLVKWPASFGLATWEAEPGDRFLVELTGPAEFTILRAMRR